MRFRSTEGRAKEVSLADAIEQGLASDGGLFVPTRLPTLPAELWSRFHGASLESIAFELGKVFFSDDISTDDIRAICRGALDFPIPLVEIERGIHVLELFHGPTHAFKDVGARFLARLLGATRSSVDEAPLTVLVATSGDTGGAVAAAFAGVQGARVAILYPAGQVTPLQEKQICTWGTNVRAMAVDGSFDDCQRLVKMAFADEQLDQNLRLTSANSINVGRLLPQSIYYLYAACQLSLEKQVARELWFSVPSGNFGNLTAGLYAKALGLDARFIAATNANDVVPRYLGSGRYQPRSTIHTISNAMDVGRPSNFARIHDLYRGDAEQLGRHVRAAVVSDDETRAAIADVAGRLGYVMDPHTAVAYTAAKRAQKNAEPPTQRVVLATAHPAKFRESIEPVLGRPVELPVSLSECLERESRTESLRCDFDALKNKLNEAW